MKKAQKKYHQLWDDLSNLGFGEVTKIWKLNVHLTDTMNSFSLKP